MTSGMPALSHQEQQFAAERIHALMAEGLTSGEAIMQVAGEIRATHKGARTHVMYDEDEQ